MSRSFGPLARRVLWLITGLLACAAWSAAALAQPSAAAATPGADTQAAVPTEAEQGPIPTTDVLGILRKGGVLMIPIGLCSLVMMTVVFERLVSLRRGRIIPKPFVTRFMQQLADGELDRDQALELCEQNGSPAAQIFAGAVRKWGRPAVEVEQAIIDAGERVTNGLRRYLRAFHAIATLSPLLGLLGTVTGMISCFNDIATREAMGRAELLARGISEALLTTAGGLMVAIPALIFYLFFISRVDRLIMDLDALGQQLVAVLCDEAKPRSTRTGKSRRPKTQEEAA